MAKRSKKKLGVSGNTQEKAGSCRRPLLRIQEGRAERRSAGRESKRTERKHRNRSDTKANRSIQKDKGRGKNYFR